jgi:AcrR family transcriptional regulator
MLSKRLLIYEVNTYFRRKQTNLNGLNTTETAATGARLPAEARREALVRAAMDLFAQRGFRGTTTREIAQAAGVSEAIIFRHFANKHELYAAILDHKACHHAPLPDPRALLAAEMAAKDDRAVFCKLAVSFLEFHERDPQFIRLLMYSALEGHELKEMFLNRNVRELYDLLGDYVRRRQAEKVFREMNPLIVVRAFFGMVIHHLINKLLWDTEERFLHISNDDAAREFTEILLRGIAR